MHESNRRKKKGRNQKIKNGFLKNPQKFSNNSI